MGMAQLCTHSMWNHASSCGCQLSVKYVIKLETWVSLQYIHLCTKLSGQTINTPKVSWTAVMIKKVVQ